MSIAVLTPSRARPQALADMLRAIADTAARRVVVYVGLDDDDSGYPEVALTPAGLHSTHVAYIRGPRQQLAGWTNDLAKIALEDGHDILASFGDDHRPRTPGWDTRVEEGMADLGSGLVYTRDGLQDERLPTAPFWSADIIRELGWFFPPGQKHLYADDFWLRFAQNLERVSYLPDVLIEHLHPSATGEEPDAINVENDSYYDADREAYEAFIASPEYQDCLARVQAIL